MKISLARNNKGESEETRPPPCPHNATGYGSDASRAAMSWYGEISGVTALAAFGIIVPGSDFPANDVQNISATYIANGDYDEKVKVAANVFGGDVVVDVVDPWSTDGADEVAFKADDDATVAGAVGLTAAGAAIDETGTITEESGDTVAVNSLWLKMSSTYDVSAAQSGNIYFMIANGD